MEQKAKKSLNQTMRALHRDIGFFIVGLVVIYGLSGIVLIYRDSDFMKHQIAVEKKLDPNIDPVELGKALRIREFKVTKSEGDLVYFENGTYNKSTGLAKFTIEDIIFPFNKLNNFHKASNEKATHWFNLLFGILLLFMAISSLWMFKKGTKLFRRGLIITGVGIIFVTFLLLID